MDEFWYRTIPLKGEQPRTNRFKRLDVWQSSLGFGVVKEGKDCRAGHISVLLLKTEKHECRIAAKALLPVKPLLGAATMPGEGLAINDAAELGEFFQEIENLARQEAL